MAESAVIILHGLRRVPPGRHVHWLLPVCCLTASTLTFGSTIRIARLHHLSCLSCGDITCGSFEPIVTAGACCRSRPLRHGSSAGRRATGSSGRLPETVLCNSGVRASNCLLVSVSTHDAHGNVDILRRLVGLC